MRCSTVTPGKFATFCRSPVRRLNSVDFPEFGGPMIATTCGRTAGRAGSGAVATAQPPQVWQSLMAQYPGRFFSTAPAESIEQRFHAAAQLQIHPRDRRAVLLPERYEPEPLYDREGN